MLVLGRTLGQKIVIKVRGVEVKIEVVEIHPGKIRLGVDAPSEVTIHREEVQQRIDAGIPRRKK